MSAQRRAVVDTNILVSALLKSGSLPAAIAQQIRDGSLTPVVCDEIIYEYRSVLRRSKLMLDGADTSELIDLLASRADWVRLPPPAAALDLPDPDDWPFIGCAVAVQCPVITGNVRHFPAQTGVQAVTARQWLEMSRANAG